MYLRHYIGFTYLAICSMLMGMDEPPSLELKLIKKSDLSINFANQKQAFEQLTKNNACLLKKLVGKERQGKYNPILEQAEELLHTVYPTSRSRSYLLTTHLKSRSAWALPPVTHAIGDDFTQIESSETREFVSLIAERALRQELLIEEIDRHGNSCEILKIIDQNPYVVNAYGTYNDRIMTPLHYVLNKAITNLATKFLITSYVDLLLKNGANSNAQDNFGNTPMHHARTPELIELLYLNGAEINKEGYCGRTPLFHHIKLSNWQVVLHLLQYSADPNKTDDKGNTCLRKAIAKKNPEIVKLLLEYGADWTQEDGKNKGRLVDYTECLRVLRNHINTHIKDLLVKEFNLMAIHNIMHSPCIHIIETEMLDELMQWIPKHCAEEFQYSNSGAHVLYEHLYEISKKLLSATESGLRYW